MILTKEKIEKLKETKYGKLLPIMPVGKTKAKKTIWEFLCDCGNSHNSVLGDVTSGRTVSCGCHKSEATAARNTTHGLCNTKVYRAYCNIMDRCTNPNNPAYVNYGGRGIVFQWEGDFIGFYEHIGDPPVDDREISVERINNNLGYVAGNIKWATREEQNRNQRLRITNKSGVKGVFLYLAKDGYKAWVTKIGSEKTKYFSIKKYGYSEAFNLACQYRKQRLEELKNEGIIYTEYYD